MCSRVSRKQKYEVRRSSIMDLSHPSDFGNKEDLSERRRAERESKRDVYNKIRNI
jgi:hypothetical protein